MILILLGTQDKPFTRLLNAVENGIEKGYIREKVIAQIGFTKYKSSHMETFDLIPSDRYEEIIKEASLIITHAGIGSILTGLKFDKKVIVAARLKQFGEHTNDHQLQILDELSGKGFILRLDDFDKLDEVLEKARTFIPNKYRNNNRNFVKVVEEYIDSL